MSETVAAGRWSEVRPLWALAWPSVLGMLGFMGLSVIDVVMVGRFGEQALGAISLSQSYVISLMVLCRGVLRSAEPRLSQAWGANDPVGFARAWRAAALAAAMVALPAMSAFVPAELMLTLLRQPAEIIPLAADWCRIMALTVPAQLWFGVELMVLTASGAVRVIPVVVGGANLLNIGLNLLLMYGVGGWPGLGPIGAAWSTVLVEWLMPVVLILLMREERAARWREVQVSLGEACELLRAGLPVGIQQGLEVWGWVLTSLIMGWIGTEALAAHTVTINLTSISFMLPLGIATAASARVGNLIGAGRSWAAAAWTAVLLGVGAMCLSAAAFALAPEALARLYTDDPKVVVAACALLPIAAAFQIFDGAQGVSFGVLRGAGDLRYGAVANIVGYYLVGIPLGIYLSFSLGLGPRGVWIGLVAALAVISALLFFRVRWLLAHRPAIAVPTEGR